ncbi:hypothetical protein [Clostridium tetani]|nr:hypothetical protein [Clostridium tetani]
MELPKAVCLLRNYNEILKEEYIIENKEKSVDFTNSQIAISKQEYGKSKQGKTMIIVKEHFAENGKSLEELLTDVIIQYVRKIAI